MARKLTFALISALAFSLACVPPIPSNDRIINFDPLLTTMGAIQVRGVLRVGIPEGAPFGQASDGQRESFIALMAIDLADALGIDPEFTTGSDEELIRLIDSGDLDVAYPRFPITEEAIVKNTFADPYWIGHERVLTFSDAIESTDDLAGARVCEAIDDVTGVPVAQLQPDVILASAVSDLADCPEVDAVIGSDLLLMQLAGEGGGPPSLVGPEISTVGFGAMVLQGETGFAEYISAQLGEAKTEGRWAEWYEAAITPILDVEPPDPPGMHASEAAALYPIGFSSNDL